MMISPLGSSGLPDDAPLVPTDTAAKGGGLSARTLGIAAGAAIGSAAIAAAVLYARRPADRRGSKPAPNGGDSIPTDPFTLRSD